MGSVKDLRIIKKPTEKEMGIGRFNFSDRYSVFDWGEMPDLIENKGAALCIMGAYCFEKLEKEGIRTHYLGLIQDGKLVKIADLKKPVNEMEINLVRVVRPKFSKGKYDYSIFTPRLRNFLIPLEIIYRNRLPESSSVFKRLKEGVRPEDLGLDHYPKPEEKLEKPLFDVSTKLEEGDRYMTWKEAQEISALSDEELLKVKDILGKTNDSITKISKKANLENVDGKIELAFDPKRELMLVDVLGTLDECRFTYNDIHISKEVARQFYRKTKWYESVENAKKEAKSKGLENWKSLCKERPPKLDPALKRIIENMYASVTNQCVGISLFDAPKLREVVEEYQDYLDKIERRIEK